MNNWSLALHKQVAQEKLRVAENYRLSRLSLAGRVRKLVRSDKKG